MLVVKIYNCKLKKNKYKWRTNQNTTKTLWNILYPLNTKQVLHLSNNLNLYFSDIKNQPYTRVEIHYK